MQQVNPAGYQAATTVLNNDQKTMLMELMRIADSAEAPVNTAP